MEQYTHYEPQPDSMIITEVRTQQRNAQRRAIFINGEFALGVSEEMYVKYALFKGRVVTPELMEEVRREDELFLCKQAAIRFLARRMRSIREVEQKLAEKGFEPAAIAATVQFLAGYGMVDDREFARSFVNDQLLRRPLGRRRLSAELRRKGLAKDEIEETLSQAIGDHDELSHALAAAEKKAPSIRHDDPRKWDRTMASFLAGRGFGWDVVEKVLNRYREQRRSSGRNEESENELGKIQRNRT